MLGVVIVTLIVLIPLVVYVLSLELSSAGHRLLEDPKPAEATFWETRFGGVFNNFQGVYEDFMRIFEGFARVSKGFRGFEPCFFYG